MKPRRPLASCFCLLLAACAGRSPRAAVDDAMPHLHLSPASLGHGLAQQQQLVFRHGNEQRTLDALLEVDAREVRLDLQALGRSALRLSWDGRRLEQKRADWLPPGVRGEEVLDELQLAQWPVAAIRAALPAGWSLDEDGGVRRLRHGDVLVATVRYPAQDRIELEFARFNLSIRSAAVGEGAP